MLPQFLIGGPNTIILILDYVNDECSLLNLQIYYGYIAFKERYTGRHQQTVKFNFISFNLSIESHEGYVEPCGNPSET